jgi:four helix bundle protein
MTFPAHERFGLAQQLRRAVISAAANIVEGCARASPGEYAHHLSIAYGSACEAEYEIDLASRLGYLREADAEALRQSAASAARLVGRLMIEVQRFRGRP